MKDDIEMLIKKGRLSYYVKGGKKIGRNHLKVNPPSKTADVGTIYESNEASKGKHKYIASITWGAPRENLPSKWEIKERLSR